MKKSKKIEWIEKEVTLDELKKIRIVSLIGKRPNASMLDKREVALIRGLRGDYTQKEISKVFGISQSQVQRIMSGVCWS